MPLSARLLLLVLLWPVAVAPARAADGVLVLVAPDVEVVTADGGEGVVLPSAEPSDALAREWIAAAAAALGSGGPAGAWRPPDDPDDALVQVLALQEAVALALLEPDVRPRALSLGDGASRLAAATGATHALFARIRAAPRRGTAVAMLVDLRSGAVLHHATRDDVRSGTPPGELASRLARQLLADMRDSPARLATGFPAESGVPAPAGDVARASARLERRLRRHPDRLVDPALDATIRAIGCRVDPAACASLRPIVLRDPDPYAAILPGGALVIHTGMLLRVPDEAGLAFVLAHELAHERHGDATARLAGVGAAARGDAARARESAADADAFDRLSAAGYDPGAASDLWLRLQADETAGGPGSAAGSHPPTAERLAAARAAAAAAPGHERGADRWEAFAGPRRAGWRADGPAAGVSAADVAAAGVPAADSPPVHPASLPKGDGSGPVRTLRVFGLQLPTRLPWRQRPGIGMVAWTVDGSPLNRLVIVSGIEPGDPLLRGAAAGIPRWRGAAPGPETWDAIAAALRASGWLDVRVTGQRPHDYAGIGGGRAELSLADEGGLRYRGTLAQAVRRGELTWIAWIAPAAYYHARDAADVAAMLDGMRLR